MRAELQLGTKVEGPKGESFGKIKYLVADPNTNQLTHLVLEEGLLAKRQILVSLADIAGVSDDGQTVRLSLTKDQLGQLPEFNTADYTAASPRVGDDAHTNPNAEGFYFSPVNVPTGTAANSARAGAATVQTETPATSALIVQAGASVEGLDGKLGTVKTVNIDTTTGQVTSFTISRGLGNKEEYLVPISMVTSVEGQVIQVNMHKDSVKDLNDDSQTSENFAASSPAPRLDPEQQAALDLVDHKPEPSPYGKAIS